MFVNPRRRSKRRASKKRNPKKRTARRTAPKRRRNARKASSNMIINPRRRRTRKTRRNASITPFVKSNPLILRNPGSIRRRRRSNPTLNFNTILSKSLSYGGGSAIGAVANIVGLNKIENKWFRNGARIGVAALGGIFLKGDLGASMAGACLYPLWQEVAVMLSLVDASADVTGPNADLDVLSADLQDVLDEAAAQELYSAYN
jgi:hypothetical protein